MTKASQGRRQRRFERRGRPTGSYRKLLKDPQRFAIATWLALEPIGSHVAARAATVWIEEKTPITIEIVKENQLLMVGADFTPPAGRDLDSYASQLAEKAQLVRSRATKREIHWLTFSSAALKALLLFHMEGNAAGIEQTLKALRQAGWGEIIDRIIGRFTPALLANFPPFEGQPGAKAQQLLAILRAPKT